MRRLGALALLVALGGCSTVVAEKEPESVCPPGQERLRTAQLFFGRNVGGKPGVSQTDFQRFVDQELTPRFPDGLTVMDGGGQWRGSENQLIREASKVVLIVLPKRGDTTQRIDAVRTAYKTRFNQESVLLVTQAACVSF
ncbi:DUF3574 domain-containing protein [Phenylobacterium sp.]|jgi:hypothetical protein|uniref:DUF3574 domain-containing protein n=1 Tax=Phenylobacterium sp. TaxID=1871053 RepID=UPI002F941BE4